MLEVIIDTIKDSIRLVPFLFLAYVLMEYLEHKTSQKTKQMIRKSGRIGPLFGGILGMVPQCGFSAMGANLYAGRVITLGTLMAIFLSTSDEMIPILLSEAVPMDSIIKIVLVKGIIGILAGFVIDAMMRKRNKEIRENITKMCEKEHCHCEKEGVMKSAIKHTASILLYLAVITLLLNTVIYFIGEDKLASILFHQPILGPILAGIVGLIPNCAASVILTKLYVSGVIGVGSMLSGLLVGAGVGLLILCRMNRNARENATIIGMLYGIGIIVGILFEVIGIVW